jgi:hypothetical protein
MSTPDRDRLAPSSARVLAFLGAFEQAYGYSAKAADVDRRFGWRGHDTARRRLRDLVRRGLAERTAEGWSPLAGGEGARPRVDVGRIATLLEELAIFNRADLAEVELTEHGRRLDIPPGVIREWRELLDLSNACFVEERAWEGAFLAAMRRDHEALEARLAADGPADGGPDGEIKDRG